MLSRISEEKKPELDKRPAYQFYSQINAIIPASLQMTCKPPFIFHDANLAARMKLTRLKNDIEIYRKKLLTEESAKEQYAIQDLLYEANVTAKRNLEKAIQDLEKVKLTAEIEKNKLMAEESALGRDLQIAVGRLVLKQGEKMVENNKKYDQLDNKKNDLLRRQSELNKVIDSKCCGCFSSRVAKEVAELKQIEAEINGVMAEIEALGMERAEFLVQEKASADLKKLLQEVRQKKMAHITEYPHRLKEADERVKQAQVALARTNIEIEKRQSRYYAAISEALMQHVIDIYAQYLAFKAETDALYTGRHGNKKVNEAAEKFNGALSFAKDRLDELMQQLWCPTNKNQNAKTLYMATQGKSNHANSLTIN